ncbi:MAG TPA: AI-2E family transporter [Cytophagales bacterium]|mgnify:CR=1 FL=1|nr:AI-2E family transporter [Cytophagales bacterium]
MTEHNRKQLDVVFKLSITIALLLVSLYFLKSLLMPLVFSFLMVMVLVPLCQKLESWKIGRILSILIVLFMVFVVVVGLALLMSTQFNRFITDFPDLEGRLQNLLVGLITNIEGVFNISQQEQLGFLKDNATEFFKTGSKYFSSAIGATTDAISFMGLVPVYCFLILLYREKFKNVILKLISSEREQSVVDIYTKMRKAVQQYVTGLGLVVLIIAVLNVLGLSLLGIKYAVFLGIFSALLTVIPYVGVFIGGLLPVLIALITKDSMWYPLGVIGLYWLVQILEGNFITPRIVGSQVNINALAVIFGLLAGGQLWGVAGMVMAVPILAVIKVVFSHVDSLKPLAEMLEQ